MSFKRKNKSYQYIYDLYECDKNIFPLNNLGNIIKNIIKDYNLTVVKHTHFIFKGQGITYVNILSQSHLIIHTWPEFNFISIDLFSCSGDINIKQKFLTQYFSCKKIKKKRIVHRF